MAFLVDDFLNGVRLQFGKIDTDSGTIHSRLSQEESLRYIEEVFTDYKKYGRIKNFHGVAAELGPGDNAGLALLMRQDGCERVDLIDRFFSRREPEQQSKIYAHLANKYSLARFRTKDSWNERELEGVIWKFGQPAEVYFLNCAKNLGRIYDFIVSRAVLEHLYDPLNALKYMVECLKPGGQMLHKVDLRDHGMFTPTQHELTFLKMPSAIYPFMVSNSGRPNRILVHRYREVLEEMKTAGLINYSLLVTRLVGVGEITPHKTFQEIDLEKQSQAVAFVEKHRQKFASEFSHIPSQDLAISGIWIDATKR